MPFDPPLTTAELKAVFAGAYEIDSALQAGGQGAVFRARAVTNNGAAVALKIYHVDQSEERLEREIGALKTLRGPTLDVPAGNWTT